MIDSPYANLVHADWPVQFETECMRRDGKVMIKVEANVAQDEQRMYRIIA